jgi:hypothetical protein
MNTSLGANTQHQLCFSTSKPKVSNFIAVHSTFYQRAYRWDGQFSRYVCFGNK